MAKARSETPILALAVQIARNTCHLCTAFSDDRAFAFAWVATWASVSDRRPKGVVPIAYSLICLSSGQKKSTRQNDAASLDRDSGKWSSLGRHTERRRLPNGDVWGPFPFAGDAPLKWPQEPFDSPSRAPKERNSSNNSGRRRVRNCANALPVCFASVTFTSRSEVRISASARPVASLISMIGRPRRLRVSCRLAALSARENRSSPPTLAKAGRAATACARL